MNLTRRVFLSFLVAGALVLALIQTTNAAAGSAPTPTPTEVPIITIGGPHPGTYTTRITVGPVIEGLRLSLTPAVVSGRIGQPIMVSLWLNNAGDRDRLVCFGSFGYHLKFIVASVRNGNQVPQRQASGKYSSIMRPGHCDLEPYKQWRYDIPVDEFASITQPGRYSVQATLDVITDVPAKRFVLHSNTIELNVTP